MATEMSNSFGDVGALRFVSVKGWISGIYFLLYRKPLNQNKMEIVIFCVMCYLIGIIVGIILNNN